MQTNKLARNTAIYALGDIVPKLLGFISFPILTSYLSPLEYGIVNYVNTINLFLTAIGFMCLNTYYLVYYFRVGGIDEQKKLLGNLSFFIYSVNILLLIPLFFMGSRLMNLLGSNIDFYPYIAIGIVTNFFNLLGVLPSALFRVQERPLPLTLLNIFKGILGLVLTLCLVVFYDFKALGVLYANMIVAIIFGIIFTYILLKNIIFNINYRQLRSALIFSLPLLPGTLSYYITSMSDRILIDKYLNLTDLGLYSTASTLALMLNIITNGAYKAFEPHFFKVYGTSVFDSQFKAVRDRFFFLVLIASLGLALFAKDFFTIFASKDFIRAYYYVPIILIGLIASSVGILYSTIVTARNKTKINSANTILAGFISISLNTYFLPRIGVIAACMTSSFSFFVSMCISIYFSKIKISNIRLFIAFLLSVLVVYFMVYTLTIDDLFYSIILNSFIYIIMVLLIAYILRLNLRHFKM